MAFEEEWNRPLAGLPARQCARCTAVRRALVQAVRSCDRRGIDRLLRVVCEADAMSERLIELAKRIQRRPYNRPGSDKTWVVQSMWAHLKFAEEVRQADRVRGR